MSDTREDWRWLDGRLYDVRPTADGITLRVVWDRKPEAAHVDRAELEKLWNE